MKDSKIEWTTHTFNPWEGCTKVSPGCLNCYAEARNHRFGNDNWGKGKPRRRTKTWGEPVKWNKTATWGQCRNIDCRKIFAGPTWEAIESLPGMKQCDECYEPIRWQRSRVFCASLADWLDDEVPIDWLADLLKLIHDTPNLDWLLLTKRPENFGARISGAAMCVPGHDASYDSMICMVGAWGSGQPPKNVWIGTTVENQEYADKRIPELLKIPARVRFLSCEPLLGPVDLTRLEADDSMPVTYNALSGFGDWSKERVAEPIHWVIIGGESGHGARAFQIEWASDLVKQCREAGVASFVKQLGSNAQCGNANLYDWPDDTELVPSCCIAGAAACGVRTKDKKGGDWNEWPEQLRVREFPA